MEAGIETLAPWADKLVGADRRMTARELSLMPGDGRLYELVDGRLVRMTPSGIGDSARAIGLAAALLTYVEARRLGTVSGADGGYDLTRRGEDTTILAPDVAFVGAGRGPTPGTVEYEQYWPLAPDLALEVASHRQFQPAMAAKAVRYLNAGVRLLWIVWPRYRRVDVWRPGADSPVATLTDGDDLDGLDVVPGFAYPVTRLFTPLA
jgi:Uma2 family endonuclease